MIKSEKGEVRTNGNLTDIIFELHHLIRSFAKIDPEIISAVIFKNADLLQKAFDKSDKRKLQIVEDYIDLIEKTRKEVNDET